MDRSVRRTHWLSLIRLRLEQLAASCTMASSVRAAHPARYRVWSFGQKRATEFSTASVTAGISDRSRE